MQVWVYLSAFLGSLGLSLVLARAVRDYAIAHGLVSRPKSSRHVHPRPIPRLGGVAIYVSVIASVGLVMLVGAIQGASPTLPYKVALGIALPATGIFLLGLWDDLFGATPYVKLAVQAAGGVCLYLSGLSVGHLSFLPTLHGRVFTLLLTVFWVVLITNAFNLIDGLDGLAAGSALFSTIVIFSCSLLLGSASSALVTIALTGAILGFLRYNFNPASIFLGDGGSLFIGFVLSALALVQSAKATTMLAVAIPIVSFGLPVLDLGLAVVRRFLSGRPLFSADGEHIHHKLLKLGLSHRHAVLVLYGVSAIFGFTSLFMLYPSGKPMALVFTVLGLSLLMGLRQLRYLEVSEMQSIIGRTLEQKQIIANNLRIRRAAEELAGVASHAELAEVFVRALEPIGFCGIVLTPTKRIKIAGHAITPMVESPSGSLRFVWDTDRGMEHCWEVRIPLVSQAGIWCGGLSILRRDTTERLLVDINLFTHVLQSAVTDAVLRLTLIQDHESVLDAGVAEPVVKASLVRECRKAAPQSRPTARSHQ